MRVLLLAGKGGVGKTTLAAATAFGAAAKGHRTFLLSTDPAHSLGDALGREIGGGATAIAENLMAREVSVLDELDQSWSEIQGFLRQLLRDDADALVAEELLVFPGLEELIALRAIREVEATGAYDTCVVDCAPTGSTLRMLRFPDVLRLFMGDVFEMKKKGARLLRPLFERLRQGNLVPSEALFDAFERLVDDVDSVRRILMDEQRTSARLVVNPARVVVEETRRSFAYFCLYGVATDAVLVNRVLPDEAKGGYFARWAERERSELDRIAASFPVPRFQAPLFGRELRGVEDLQLLAGQLYGERDPADRFVERRPIRMTHAHGRPRIELDLPGASKEELRVDVRGAELWIRVRDASRVVALPDVMVGRAVAHARLENEVLEVAFA